jgi:hypothetical protein
MAESKKGISAKQVQRMLEVSYKTAWYLCRRIRDAMGEDEQPLLRGIVEVDETLLDGKRKGYGHGYRGNKATIAGAVERGGEIRLRLAPNVGRLPALRGSDDHLADREAFPAFSVPSPPLTRLVRAPEKRYFLVALCSWRALRYDA